MSELQGLKEQMQQLRDAMLTSDTRHEEALKRQPETHAAAMRQQQDIFERMMGLVQNQVAATTPVDRASAKRSLVDNRLKKQQAVCNNTEASFQTWSRKTEGHVSAIYKEATEVLIAVTQQQKPVNLRATMVECADVPDRTIEELNQELYHYLIELTDGESFDLVVGAGRGQGLEAWRRLQTCMSPTSIQASRMPSWLLSPEIRSLLEQATGKKP